MIKFLAHFFTPQISNNYRSKILHPKIISAFIVFFFILGVFVNFLKSNYPQVLGMSSDISIEQLLILTNQKRQENGLPPLSLNSQLSQAAIGKGNDMLSKNYWAHISPDGTTPWLFIKGSGYNYSYAGENLARGYSTSEDVINAWMASPTHKENMLSSKYQDIGFAVVTGNLTGEETVLVVEMLGATGSSGETSIASKKPAEIASAQNSVIPSSTPTPTLTPIANAQALSIQPLINGAVFSKSLTRSIAIVFIFVLTLDMVIIERKKILRFVGHNLDHVLFLGAVLAVIFILMRGSVV